jgi:hypothetical protein
VNLNRVWPQSARSSGCAAHSGERDRLKVISASGDRDHADHGRQKPGVMVAARMRCSSSSAITRFLPATGSRSRHRYRTGRPRYGNPPTFSQTAATRARPGTAAIPANANQPGRRTRRKTQCQRHLTPQPPPARSARRSAATRLDRSQGPRSGAAGGVSGPTGGAFSQDPSIHQPSSCPGRRSLGRRPPVRFRGHSRHAWANPL